MFGVQHANANAAAHASAAPMAVLRLLMAINPCGRARVDNRGNRQRR